MTHLKIQSDSNLQNVHVGHTLIFNSYTSSKTILNFLQGWMKKDISTGKIIHVYYHDKTGIYKLLFTHKKYIYLKDISYWT